MTELFLKLFNMSISASWLVLAVLVLRLLLKRAPKWAAPALWGIVGLRLICPLSIESVFSLIPSAETVSPEIMMDPKPAIDSGVPILNQAVNPVIAEHFTPNPAASANPLQIWLFLAAAVWLIGMTAMLLYALVSWLLLKRRLRTAVRLRDNIFQSENVSSPFVLGVVRPRIYLPFDLGEGDMAQVLAHEEAHIARRDHWWKPLGFLLLSVYWFNPLLWAAYVLLCRDIELACDERVVQAMAAETRADYSQALLNCGVKGRLVTACPLAFGEVGVKERVKRVLSYKKPAFWLTVAAVAVCAVVAVCFLTDPMRGEDAAGDVVWRDEDYGAEFPYELRLPASWRGRFDTLAGLSLDAEEKIDGYSVEFHQQKRSALDLDGLVFTLTVRPDEGQTVEEIQASLPPVPSAYLGRGGGWIYYVYYASDVRVDPANQIVAQEYQELRADAEAQLGPDSFTYLGEDTQARWSFEGTVFRYGGKEFDLTERNGGINSIQSCTPAGRYLVVEGHVGPHNGVYCIFDMDAEEFVKDIAGSHLIWRGDDLTTAVYTFWNEIYYYDGELVKALPLTENEFIYKLEFIGAPSTVKATIVGDSWDRTEYVELSRFSRDSSLGPLTMDLLRELVEKGDFEKVDFAAYSNAGINDLSDHALNYTADFELEEQGKSYCLAVSRMKDDNTLNYVELRKNSNGESLWLRNARGETLEVQDLDKFLAHDYDIRDKVSWTTPAGLTETEYRADCGIAGGVLLKPDAYEPLDDPENWSCPPEWAAAGMVSEYYTDGLIEWNGAEIGTVYEFNNHTWSEPVGPVDGLCAPAYLIKSNHDLYTAGDLGRMEEQGIDTESLETTSDYWYVWFARPGEEKGVVISLNAKNFSQEDVLEFARSVRY